MQKFVQAPNARWSEIFGRCRSNSAGASYVRLVEGFADEGIQYSLAPAGIVTSPSSPFPSGSSKSTRGSRPRKRSVSSIASGISSGSAQDLLLPASRGRSSRRYTTLGDVHDRRRVSPRVGWNAWMLVVISSVGEPTETRGTSVDGDEVGDEVVVAGHRRRSSISSRVYSSDDQQGLAGSRPRHTCDQPPGTPSR